MPDLLVLRASITEFAPWRYDLAQTALNLTPHPTISPAGGASNLEQQHHNGSDDRMPALGQAINISLLVGLAVLTWVLPRRSGLPGMLAAQALAAIGFPVMGVVALATGAWPEYEDGLAIVALLF